MGIFSSLVTADNGPNPKFTGVNRKTPTDFSGLWIKLNRDIGTTMKNNDLANHSQFINLLVLKSASKLFVIATWGPGTGLVKINVPA